MSDIAKKTLPPGSWPGHKGGAKTAESTTSDAAAPRSAASPPPAKELSEAPSDDASPSHYTHQKENPLEDIEEEDGPIKMTDTDASQKGQDVNGELEEVTPQPEQEVNGVEQEEEEEGEQSQATTEQKEEGTEVQDEASSKTSLTEQAKEAFDKASENQPTSEARESFLKAAESGAALTDRSRSGKAQSEVSGTAKSGEQVQTSQAEAQEAPTEIQEEQAPSVSQKGTEAGEEATAAVSEKSGSEAGVTQRTAPTGIQEPTATEGSQVQEGSQPQEQEGSQVLEGSQVQTQTEQAPTELDSKAAEGIEAQDTVPQGAQTATESATVAENLDFSVLKGGKVNKGGNVVDSDGKVVGRVTEGILMYLVGKRVDENGDIWSDNGKVIGRAEPITDSERDDMMKEPAPFESFPDAVVDGNGMVVSNGEWIGKVIEGDIKQLRGKSVDPDGDILDKGGNVIGKAERWEPEPEAEPEPEPEVDRSILAGKRVNKAGNVVDGSGVIFGHVVEGDVKRMVGRMCNKNGEILSESGDVLGRAEVVSEGEREGLKEGPFAELEGCTVAKDGTVVTPSGDIVGRLISGDGKVLFGRPVDEDGDVLDRNGNVIGKAERWEPEEVEKKKNAMSGRRVNREGNVVDEDGNIIGKLTSGDPNICNGKEIDDDGDVVDQKGTVVGHCTLLQDLPKETPEEKEKAEQLERDKKLAAQMSVCIEQCLDKIRPICKMITEV